MSRETAPGTHKRPRVGILTLTQSENYGTVLQAYATRRIFESLSSSLEFQLVPTDVRHVRRRRLQSLVNPRNPNTGITRINNFLSMRRFIRSELAPAGRYIDIKKRTAAIEHLNQGFEALITGSDEVWNLAFVGAQSLYYLPHGAGRYRASFATSANRLDIDALDSQDRNLLHNSLKSYSYLSVRDTNTRNFLRDLDLSLDPIEIVDPTLVYDFPEAEPRRRLGSVVGSMESHILLMVRDRHIASSLITYFADVWPQSEIHTVFIKHAHTKYLRIDPLEFAGVFSEYDLVITDFFHGTCMSIRNRAAFICFDSETIYDKYESKIANLVRKLGLTGNYVNIANIGRQEGLNTLYALAAKILDGKYWSPDFEAALARERITARRVATEIVRQLEEELAVVDKR